MQEINEFNVNEIIENALIENKSLKITKILKQIQLLKDNKAKVAMLNLIKLFK